MLKPLKIKNFLLLKYKRQKLIIPDKDYSLSISDKEKEIYKNCHEVLFHRTVEQIQYFHPDAHIHVLTNEKLNSINGITYHYRDEVWNDLLCKFKLYSLIDEPAMYIDLDIIFTKPIFVANNTTSPFCFFNTSQPEDLQIYSNKTLPIKQNVIYNSGIVWINKPSDDLTSKLYELHERYFSDTDMILSKNLWPNNDEHALSLFVGMNNWEMPLDDRINMSRNKLWKMNIPVTSKVIEKYQSLHYNGLKTKQSMIDEYNLYPISRQHKNEMVKQYFGLDHYA